MYTHTISISLSLSLSMLYLYHLSLYIFPYSTSFWHEKPPFELLASVVIVTPKIIWIIHVINGHFLVDEVTPLLKNTLHI